MIEPQPGTRLEESAEQHDIWEFSITPDFRPKLYASTPPSAFHRLMQRWILGVYWRRVKV